jgi:hypothetical protein
MILLLTTSWLVVYYAFHEMKQQRRGRLEEGRLPHNQVKQVVPGKHKWNGWRLSPGLPDLSRYNIPNWENIYQKIHPLNKPLNTYTKWPLNVYIYQKISIQGLQKHTKNRNLLFANIPSGNPESVTAHVSSLEALLAPLLCKVKESLLEVDLH